MKQLTRKTMSDPAEYSDMRELGVGEFWTSSVKDKTFVITYRSAEKVIIEDDLYWVYRLRLATSDELERIENARREWLALKPEERTEKILSGLQARFPGLDW